MEALDRVGRVDDGGIRVLEKELLQLLLPFRTVELVEHAVQWTLTHKSPVGVDLDEIYAPRSRKIHQRVTDETILLLRRQGVAYGESAFSHCWYS